MPVLKPEQVADYAATHAPELTIALEVVNRFESHFLNIAADAVRFIRDLGKPPNVKVHLDAFHMIREERQFYWRSPGDRSVAGLHSRLREPAWDSRAWSSPLARLLAGTG
jgi:hypothetical protein